MTLLSCSLAVVMPVRVDGAAMHIRADVRFHAKMPGVAFLGGTHFGVAFLPLIFGRGRGMDNRRVDDAAARQQQAVLTKIRLDRLKHRTGQVMFLQQMPEVQDRGLVEGAQEA